MKGARSTFDTIEDNVAATIEANPITEKKKRIKKSEPIESLTK